MMSMMNPMMGMMGGCPSDLGVGEWSLEAWFILVSSFRGRRSRVGEASGRERERAGLEQASERAQPWHPGILLRSPSRIEHRQQCTNAATCCGLDSSTMGGQLPQVQISSRNCM